MPIKCKGFIDLIQKIHNSQLIRFKDKHKYLGLGILAECRRILCDYKRTQSLTSNEISSRDQYFLGLLMRKRHEFVIGILGHLRTSIE